MSFTWLSVIEIMVVCFMVSHLVIPFMRSNSSRLVIYLTGYIILALIAYIADLPFLLMFLDRYGSTLLIIYLLSPKLRNRQVESVSVVPSKFDPQRIDDLVNMIMQVGLHNSYNQKASIFICEGLQSLTDPVRTTLPLNIVMTKEILAALCNTSLYNSERAMWISYNGLLKGINCTLHTTENSSALGAIQLDDSFTNNIARQITKNYDACILYNSPIDRLWTCIIEDSIFAGLSAVAASRILKKHLLFLYKCAKNNGAQLTSMQKTL